MLGVHKITPTNAEIALSFHTAHAWSGVAESHRSFGDSERINNL